MQLIKSNSHGNGTRVMICDDGCYHKVAYHDKANKVILRERQGYDWFGINTKLSNTRFLWLTLPKFKGKTFTEKEGITGNERWIKELIKFYNIKWKENKFAIHGDLALCNIIFGVPGWGRLVSIVDWEHFHYADKKYFGFDIINMLFIHLQYEYRWLSYWGFNWVPFIKKRHKEFIKECINMLGLSEFLTMPFSNSSAYIKRNMNKDKFILGKQKDALIDSLDNLCC